MHLSGPNPRVTLGQCSGHWGQISSRDNPAHLESLGESLRAQLCVLALTWLRPSVGRLMRGFAEERPS